MYQPKIKLSEKAKTQLAIIRMGTDMTESELIEYLIMQYPYAAGATL